VALMMNLMRRSKSFGGGLDLRGAANPHIHRQPDNRVGGELVQVYVEIPEDIDDGRMKGEPESREQEIPKVGCREASARSPGQGLTRS
jgi:hypothetical protein